MNQRMIAGLGNVYTDEILFQAGIHPKTKADRIQAEALEALFQIMREDVLPTVIDRRADPSRFPEEYLIPRRKKRRQLSQVRQRAGAGESIRSHGLSVSQVPEKVSIDECRMSKEREGEMV